MRYVTIALALVAGITFATISAAEAAESPLEIAGATTISVAEAKALFDSGVIFIDVRKDSDWEAGRVPGAVHLELKKVLSAESLGEIIAMNDTVVIYCNGPKCMRSSKACAKAVEWGFTNVRYFRGGFPDWQSAGYPVE